MKRRPTSPTCMAACAVLALLAGCSESETAPASGGTGGSTATGGASASGGSGGAKALTCPTGTQGAKLIFVQTDTGAAYCIDQREVTRGEYKAFLDAKNGDVKGQPPGCAWNERFAPLIPDPNNPEAGCPTDSWALETSPDYPVVCVDICDAIAYCSWAGKRLCGVIGASATDLNQVTDHKTVASGKASEWTYACTQGGKTQYPYGNTYEPGKCIDKTRIDAGGLAAREATTEPPESCHGTESPFDEIFHMSGSVAEWINVCDPTYGVNCTSGGGSWGQSRQSPESISCTPTGSMTKQSIYSSVGFRCCADAAFGSR